LPVYASVPLLGGAAGVAICIVSYFVVVGLAGRLTAWGFPSGFGTLLSGERVILCTFICRCNLSSPSSWTQFMFYLSQVRSFTNGCWRCVGTDSVRVSMIYSDLGLSLARQCGKFKGSRWPPFLCCTNLAVLLPVGLISARTAQLSPHCESAKGT